jgi:hypothetical protein
MAPRLAAAPPRMMSSDAQCTRRAQFPHRNFWKRISRVISIAGLDAQALAFSAGGVAQAYGYKDRGPQAAPARPGAQTDPQMRRCEWFSKKHGASPCNPKHPLKRNGTHFEATTHRVRCIQSIEASGVPRRRGFIRRCCCWTT